MYRVHTQNVRLPLVISNLCTIISNGDCVVCDIIALFTVVIIIINIITDISD